MRATLGSLEPAFPGGPACVRLYVKETTTTPDMRFIGDRISPCLDCHDGAARTLLLGIPQKAPAQLHKKVADSHVGAEKPGGRHGKLTEAETIVLAEAKALGQMTVGHARMLVGALAVPAIRNLRSKGKLRSEGLGRFATNVPTDAA